MTDTTQSPVVITTMGNCFIHHLSPHPLFYKVETYEREGDVDVHTYLPLAPDGLVRQQLQEGIEGGDNETWKYALVRNSRPGKGGYYPLPLLFARPEYREVLAKQRGSKPPRESWITAQRELVLRHYNLHLPDDHHLILNRVRPEVPLMARVAQALVAAINR